MSPLLSLCCLVVGAVAMPAIARRPPSPPLIVLVLPTYTPFHDDGDDTVTVENAESRRRPAVDVRTVSIGGIVGAVPWLPLEVNVPDAVAWLYQHIVDAIPWYGRPQTAYLVGQTPERFIYVHE